MAIENGTQNVELAYLLDPAFQIEGLNGKPVIGGWLNVYEAGTDTKVITYQDFEGSRNPFNIKLGSDGRAVILVDPSITYDVYAFDSYGNQIFSRLNVQCNVPGTINLSGADTRIKNTDGTLDISLQTIGNNVREYTVNTRNKLLDVQSPLYFVENSNTATIIGFSGDDYATKDYVNSALSSKLDITAYSSQSGDFLTDKFEYDSDNHITAYNHSAFAAGAGSGIIYEAGDHIDITNSVISVTGLPTSSDVENAISSAVTNIENKFEYNENNYITAYNNSAFAGTNYSAGDYVSIENDTISVTGLQPSGDYATKTELSGKQDTLSAGDGISIVNNIISVTSQGGGIEQVNHDDTLSGNGNNEPLGIANIEDFVKHNDLTAYQEKGDYYSASNPSGFITNDALTGLQPSGDYVTRDELTAYQPSGNYATLEDVESAVSGKQDILSAGEGIQIIDNTISVTAQGGGGGITTVNHDNTLSGNGNSEPLGLANAEDYVKQYDLTGYATTSLVSSVSSELYSAFSGISGDYVLVAGNGVELVDDPNANTTTINVTAEGTPVTAIEQMIESATSGLQPSGDYYSASNPSGFISEVPNTYLQNTDLTIVDNKITEISGVPLSAGDELPSGVMNTSALEYNAVNEISGYNGSAIAQYGAEKQWLVHDDTLVHAANSAQYALGVNLSAIAQLLGVDETVLFESTNADGTTLTTSSPITLAEDYSNFSRMRIEYRIWADQSFKYTLEEVPCRNGYFTLSHGYINAPDNPTCYEFLYGLSGNDSKLYYAYGRFSTMGQTGLTIIDNLNIMGVTGIGRKA